MARSENVRDFMPTARQSHQSRPSLDRRYVRDPLCDFLGHLQQDGRTSVSQLARDVHLSVTPTMERVRKLEAAGYIEGYFARLSARRFGLGLLAYVEVLLDRTTRDAFERFKSAMQVHDEVMECHMVAGGFDYLLKVRVRDMDSYRTLLGDRIASLPGVQQTHTYFVMEEVKSTHAIVVPG